MLRTEKYIAPTVAKQNLTHPTRVYAEIELPYFYRNKYTTPCRKRYIYIRFCLAEMSIPRFTVFVKAFVR